MKKIEIFEIRLDHPYYWPGNLLSGKLFIKTNDVIHCRSIQLKIICKSYTYWRESDGEHQRTYSQTVRPMKQTFLLFGNSEHKEIVELPAGQHYFEFQHLLPGNEFMPSSFEGQFGYIRYYVKATIDLKWKFNEEIVQPFTVYSVLNANHFSLLSPASVIQGMTKGWLHKGLLQAQVEIPKQGYSWNDKLQIAVRILNETQKEIQFVSVRHEMIIIYNAYSSTKKQTLKYEKKLNQEVSGLSLQFEIQLPNACSPTILNDVLIKVQHQLNIKIKLKGFMSGTLKLLQPFVFCTVPYDPNVNPAEVMPLPPVKIWTRNLAQVLYNQPLTSVSYCKNYMNTPFNTNGLGRVTTSGITGAYRPFFPALNRS